MNVFKSDYLLSHKIILLLLIVDKIQTMVQTKIQLDKFLNLIKDETELVIDTEFRRVDCYYPLLCLLQIATKSYVDCIDVLVIDDLTGLSNKLYKSDSLWIAHSARLDIEALYCVFNKLPAQVFDTQIAANLLNYKVQISYQELTKKLQNIYLAKAYTRFNWTIRPLPADVIKYAVDDVYYLLENYKQLKFQLKQENKFNWMQEETKKLLTKEFYDVTYKKVWKKIKGLKKLEQNAQILAIKLAAFREYQARQQNKPRQWIFTDNKLINYAQGKEQFSTNTQYNFDCFMHNNSQINLDISKSYAPSKNERIKIAQLQEIVKQQANKYNVAPEIICSKKDLLKYIRGERIMKLSKGWRFDILNKHYAW